MTPNRQKLIVLLFILLIAINYFPIVANNNTSAPLNDKWVAKPQHITLNTESSSPSGYSPSQIRSAYGLPSSGGAGATIAIIVAFDSPNIGDDLATFSRTFSLPAANLEIHPMSSSITSDSNWTEEACLDVEWAHAIAPDAKILLVEALSDSSYNLLSAVNYVRTRTDVVAVSMSWGTNEYPSETRDDLYFAFGIMNGIQFFASSGDNGSSNVLWPASSPFVVGVGGTTLTLAGDNSVASETAWNKSVGGISQYESIASYQTSYGLPGNQRMVPDVSYNADPHKGFSVYCSGEWHVMGGTSAGAPQWAAIYALGRTASIANIYTKAQTSYETHFRDITSGSNKDNTAAAGYDLVTGLGSPISTNFTVGLTIGPESGPAGGPITLMGDSLTPSSSANISYLNPITSTWIQMTNVVTDALGNFVFSNIAPDLIQSLPAGDNQPRFDNIFFQVKDTGGHVFNSSVPYREWRSGLTQVASQTAAGLFGNNTNLAKKAFVQNGQIVTVSGQWFNPSNTAVSFYWDGTTWLNSALINASGAFTATIAIPTSAAIGEHTLFIGLGPSSFLSGPSNFTVILTRSPVTTNNYVDSWHTSDFTVTLTPETNVVGTYYSINNGPVCSVSANGQPTITMEGASNSLEYWSTWNMSGTVLELPHTVLTSIQLQKAPISGSLSINGGAAQTSSSIVTLAVNANSLSGVTQMRLSNDGVWDTETWQPYYSAGASWQLSAGDGGKTVYCQLQDNAGYTATLTSTINLSTSQPTPTSSSPSQTSKPTSTPSPTTAPSKSPFPSPSPSPQVPEIGFDMILLLFGAVLFATFLFVWRYRHNNKG